MGGRGILKAWIEQQGALQRGAGFHRSALPMRDQTQVVLDGSLLRQKVGGRPELLLGLGKLALLVVHPADRIHDPAIVGA